ncbi:MAG: hypothetical protein WC856_02205 [Methylococcaceae bacterium]|jgi:hypothetical protein
MKNIDNAIDQDFLFRVLGEIIFRIERCGASPELTYAVSLASDLRQAIGNQWNQANVYAFERVKSEFSVYPDCKGNDCGATDGISHSKECQNEYNDCYIDDDIDKQARRNHVMIHGSEKIG